MKKRSTTYRLNIVDYTIFIVCSIAAVAMLYLFYRDMNSFTIKQSEEPIAKIYFKRNTAQRKFVDSDIWEVLTSSSDVYDGDRIRTSKNSEAYTEFSDGGTKIQLNEKSMIQIFQTKDQKRLDFIGGEIFIESKASENDKLVIRSGKTEISISNAAEVKIALPEVSESAAAGEVEAEESVVLVEVVSGQVEIIEQTEDGKNTTELNPMLVGAGEIVSFGTEHVASDEGSLSGSEGFVEDPDVPKVPMQLVKEGIEKTVKRASEKFAYNTWIDENGNSRHNYEFHVPLSDLTEKFRIIPKNSILELEVSGTPSASLNYFAIQIGTGEEGIWRRAHAFTWTNNHGYLAGGVPFNIKKPIVLDYDIVNTDRSEVNISYEQGVAEVVISDLQVKLKVVSLSGGHNTRVVESGYSKTFEFNGFTPFKNVWGGGPEDFDYLIVLNGEQVFGESVSIPAGKRVRISVSGTCNTEIEWFHPDLIYNPNDSWDNIIAQNWDTYQLRWSEEPTPANVPFSYSRSYEVLRSMENSNNGMLQFAVPAGAVSSRPTFSNLTITVGVD